MVMDAESSSSGLSASISQQQQQQQGEEAAAVEEGDGDDADETHIQGSPSSAALETEEIGKDEEEESTVTESPFLVFPPGMINVRRQGAGGGWYKESGLNCSTPTRPKHSDGDNWMGDLFSRGRLTRSRRTQNDELVELDHSNVARKEVEVGEGNEDEGDEDVEDTSGNGEGGDRSPVTPRSQFGRWKYSIMMSQSTMKPPKLSNDDQTAVEEEHGDDDGDQDEGDGDEDGKGDVSDTQWPFGNNHNESDPSTPKRRPFKIPRGRFMSPTSPTFRDSGCDDNEVEQDDSEEDDDDGVGSDQEGDASNDDSRILDSFSSSQQEQRAGRGDSATDSNTSGNWSKMIKSPKLSLRHLGGLPASPLETSSASFHTPPRKRTRKDLDDGYGLRRPPPAPKLISPEHVLQFFPTNSQSPSVIKSLQLRRN
ncbi:hypothetical protein BGZ96_001235 [Linnemannia gamsii]|uniref:Uncharacterized protein n=1 Tax=Linnemannia gamsii TaxID=64522 RepID=A0ABQ7KHH1_9FUNG|nr:hypothetical protein BGZ96_001235 [Linnemannia gamsii]